MGLPWGIQRKQCPQTTFPRDELRKLAAANYILRGSSFANHTNTKVEVRSDTHFLKRAHKNLNLLTIASNTSELFQKTDRNPSKVAKQMSYSAT